MLAGLKLFVKLEFLLFCRVMGNGLEFFMKVCSSVKFLAFEPLFLLLIIRQNAEIELTSWMLCGLASFLISDQIIRIFN